MEDSKTYLKPFLLVLFFFVLLFAYSKFGPNLPFQILNQEKGQPLVVSAEGKAVFTNNEAKITVGIQDSGQSLSSVQTSVNNKSKTLTDKLKSMGIADTNIKTISYNVSPEQDFNTNPSKITGYMVSIQYEVDVKNIDKLNDILAGITANGANLVGGVSFDVDDATKLTQTNKAREDAVAKAKDKAQGLAKAAGVSLGKIINVSEATNSGGPIPLTATSFDSKAGLGGSTPVVQPGTNEIDLTVSLTYEIR